MHDYFPSPPYILKRYAVLVVKPERAKPDFIDGSEIVWIDRRTGDDLDDKYDWYAPKREGRFDPNEILAGDILEDMVGTDASQKEGWKMLALRYKSARERGLTLDPQEEAEAVSKLVDPANVPEEKYLMEERNLRAEWKRKGEAEERLRDGERQV